jgi:hypothetical protein
LYQESRLFQLVNSSESKKKRKEVHAVQAHSPNNLELRRPLPTLALYEELPDSILRDTESALEEELEKTHMMHVRCDFFSASLCILLSRNRHCGRTQ